MQADDARALQRRLERGGWWDSARRFADALRGAGHEPGRLLLLGPQDAEPWHLAAHLTEAATRAGRPLLAPTLVRHHVPSGAPAHLAVGLDVLEAAGRGTTVLTSSATQLDGGLLERLAQAGRRGAGLYALHAGDPDLAAMVRAELTEPASAPGAVPHLLPGLLVTSGARRRWWQG